MVISIILQVVLVFFKLLSAMMFVQRSTHNS